jgi:RNA polymerase primary sigma factor
MTSKMLPAFYQKAVNENFSPLTHEEEIELILRHRAGDRRALSKLINAQMKCIVGIARAYADIQSPIEDCVQEGILCFPKAIEDFDTTMGFRFYTFVSSRIRDQIQKYVFQNDIVRLPMTHVKAIVKAKKVSKNEEEELIEVKHRRAPVMSLNAPVGDDASTTYEDTLVAEDNFEHKFEMKADLHRYIKSIDKSTPQWQMLDMFYGFSGEKHTMEEIANHFHCKKQNVDYHIQKLMASIRLRNRISVK